MDCNVQSDELQHWGIRGMRWGIRRYQNPDGSLTPAGRKRYNQEVEKLKKETAKVTAAEKIAVTRKKTQSKLDALEAKKQELEARKKALKSGGKDSEEDQSTETVDERRAKLLTSVDPKELYRNKDILSTNELNERLNRIDTEARLKSKIVEEPAKTGLDYMRDKMNRASDTVNDATNLFRRLDGAYSTVANSAIGKTIAKQLGIEVPKKEFNLTDLWKNKDKLTTQEMLDLNKRLTAEESIQNKIDARNARKESEKQAKAAEKAAEKAAKAAEKAAKKAEKKYNEAQKQVEDYFNDWQNGKTESSTNSVNTSSGKTSGQRDTTKFFGIGDTVTEKYTGPSTVEGVGTSRSSIKESMESGKKWWDTSSAKDWNYSDVSSKSSSGETIIAGLLEGPVGNANIAGLLENKDR